MSQANPAIAPVPGLKPYIFTDQLTTDFARGWRKLSDELKHRILAYNLVEERPLGLHHFLEAASHYDHVLHHHLALGPEIASVARRVYYEKNTFTLNEGSKPSDPELPPYEVRKYIKRLVSPPLCIIFASHWSLFKALASGLCGFTGLQHITVRVHFWGIIENIEKRSDLPAAPIHFKCHGQIEFTSAFEHLESDKNCIEKLFIFAEK